MRTPNRRGTATRIGFLAIVGLVLAACGSASATAAPAYEGYDSGFNGGAMPAASTAPSAAAAYAPGANGQGGSAGGDPNSAPSDPTANSLQVVYTGTLQLVVADVPQAVAQAKTAVLAAGGYIGGSQESNAGDQPSATITYRIPAAKWDDTITAIRGTATKVVDQQTQAAEVGGQLVDLEARIANLRASETSLQKIAEGAANVNDLLSVQNQLTDVRGQIEELDAQRARLADQVSYGTLVTTFGVEIEQVKTAAKGWDPSSDVDGATAAMISLGQHLASAAIWFVIVWVPVLIVVGIAAFVAWKLFRRLSPKAPASSAGPVPGWGDGSTPPPAPPAS